MFTQFPGAPGRNVANVQLATATRTILECHGQNLMIHDIEHNPVPLPALPGSLQGCWVGVLLGTRLASPRRSRSRTCVMLVLVKNRIREPHSPLQQLSGALESRGLCAQEMVIMYSSFIGL